MAFIKWLASNLRIHSYSYGFKWLKCRKVRTVLYHKDKCNIHAVQCNYGMPIAYTGLEEGAHN